MAMALYFEPGAGAGARRLAVRLDTRQHELHLMRGYESVDVMHGETEYAIHDASSKVRAGRRRLDHVRQAIALPDGEQGGPSGPEQRARWLRELRHLERQVPYNQRQLASAERRMAMIRAVLAGKQDDDRLPPRPAPAAPAAPVVELQPELSRVEQVARELDRLQVPAELGRPRVRDMLSRLAPDFRVGDADLSAAIKSRRSVSASA